MTTDKHKRLDVHHHVFPPDYVKAFGANIMCSPEQSIELMDANGIGSAISSISTSVEVANDQTATVNLARACNDYAAELSQDHKGRFGMFAALPMCSMDAAIREVDYALDTLASDGIVLMTNYNDKHLGDAAFDPLLAHLNRRKAIVFVHPTTCSCTPGHPDMPLPMLEFPFDTTRTIVSLLYAEAFTKYKDIQFIFCHGGGTIPFLVYRIDMMLQAKAAAVGFAAPDVKTALGGLYYELATSVSAPVVQALLDLVPIERLLLGTDYPFVAPWRIEALMAGFEGLGLSGDELEKIEFGNARTLFPRFRAEPERQPR